MFKSLTVLTVVSLFFGAVSASAGDSEYMGFTRVIQDPVSAGMGGAGVVLGNAWSSYRNAAALPFSDIRFDVAAGYQGWCPSSYDPTSDINVGVAWNIGKKRNVSVAAGFTYGIGEKYETSVGFGSHGGSFTPSEIQANVGVAWKFVPFLSLGVNVKYLGDKLTKDVNYEAVSSDIFLMTKISDFRVALGVSSLGSKAKSSAGTSYPLPASITLGAGYSHVFGKGHGLDILLDGDYYYNSSTASVAVGAGYTWNDHVSVRAGYHYGSETSKSDGSVVSCVIPSYASVGIGGKVLGIRIDAAYLIPTDSDSPLKN
ncbi:MAG: PorV/PorQ family protein, partial [Bacteroidales bacterium]|nr:PorV/PorQ family protein [Bacteroidales bacterium]